MVATARRLLRRLNPYCAQALTAAAALCQTRGHGHISIEHWLLKQHILPVFSQPLLQRQASQQRAQAVTLGYSDGITLQFTDITVAGA